MSTHDFLLVFTDSGRVFRMKGYNVPEFSRTSKGIPVVNLLQMNRNEKVRALVPYTEDENIHYLFFATKKGVVKRTEIAEFYNINRNGKIAIKLSEDDELAFVKGTTGNNEIIIAGSNGKAVRFREDYIRPLGRTARGVKGFNVDGGTVIGMATDSEGQYILTITENGYGKKSPLDDYRMTSRGAKGVKTVNVTLKTGQLVCMKAVNGDEDCMIMTDSGIVIRITLKQVSVYNRSAQGVKVINVKDDQKVSTVAILEPEEEDLEEDLPEEPENNN
jgi:DNA gyrase subunit A